MSNIIYAPKSWNPISGCSPVSEGCANCWAKVMARRQRQEWGTVHLHPERLEQPLHWRKPRTVAVAFMGDLFHKDVPDDFIDKVFAVMALTPQHTYMLLTKRPERMRRYLSGIGRPSAVEFEVRTISGQASAVEIWPLPNVWLGVSCENQARAGGRIPLLLDTPAAHRWVSLEPLLGAIDMFPFTGAYLRALGKGLDLCVVGGESGPKARPCDLGWIRDVRDQCKAAGVPCYVKQMGSVWRKTQCLGRVACDAKGEDWDYWPADLRVREMPEELR